MTLAIVPLLLSLLQPDPLADRLYQRQLYPGSVRAGRPVAVRHCREAPGGCRLRMHLFARMFRAASLRFGVPAVLLAASAWHESRLSPGARGPRGSRGILQLHPRSHASHGVAFIRSKRRRRACLKTSHACQSSVVLAAAGELERLHERCGDWSRALGAYRTGRCGGDDAYAAKILRTAALLERQAS